MISKSCLTVVTWPLKTKITLVNVMKVHPELDAVFSAVSADKVGEDRSGTMLGSSNLLSLKAQGARDASNSATPTPSGRTIPLIVPLWHHLCGAISEADSCHRVSANETLGSFCQITVSPVLCLLC